MESGLAYPSDLVSEMESVSVYPLGLALVSASETELGYPLGLASVSEYQLDPASATESGS